VAFIEARVLEGFVHLIGAQGEHGGRASRCDVTEGMRQEGLAYTDRAHDRHVLMRLEETQRGQVVGIEERAPRQGVNREPTRCREERRRSQLAVGLDRQGQWRPPSPSGSAERASSLLGA